MFRRVNVIYKELLDEIKIFYNTLIQKYIWHIQNEGEKKSDKMFMDWVRQNVKDIFGELDLLYSNDISVIASLKLVKGSFVDELNWDESNKKSIRSTIINNLTGLPERIGYLINLSNKD